MDGDADMGIAFNTLMSQAVIKPTTLEKRQSVFYKEYQELQDSGKTETTSSIPQSPTKVSRNSIFSAPQAVMKPATKMTHEELESLKAGKLHYSTIHPDQDKSSITVPISFPLQQSRNDRQASVTHMEIEPAAFLSNDFFKSQIPIEPQSFMNQEPFKQDTQGPNTQQPLKQLTLDLDRLDLTFRNEGSVSLDSSKITLSFIPITKNLLGEGRYAQVYRGEYSIQEDQATVSSATTVTPTDTFQRQRVYPCAVKRVHATAEAQAVGHTEAFILRRLSPLHTNIIQFIGALDEKELDSSPDFRTNAKRVSSPDSSSRLLVLLEFLPSGNLWDWVQSHKQHLGRKLWLKWARQLANALCVVHSCGIVHHDIKPHNILLTYLLDVRLSDFGNACFVPEIGQLELLSPFSDRTLSPIPSPVHLEPGRPTYQNSQSLKDGIGRGTLAYTAPEVILNQPYTFSVDIYSLGVTFFSLVTGANPFLLAKTNIQMMMGIKRGFFGSNMQSSFNGRFLTGEQVDARIIALIEQMVDLDPTNRPSAKQVIEILEQIDV